MLQLVVSVLLTYFVGGFSSVEVDWTCWNAVENLVETTVKDSRGRPVRAGAKPGNAHV